MRKHGVSLLIIAIICSMIVLAGIFNGQSESCPGVIAFSKTDAPSYAVSFDGNTCYYDLAGINWVEPGFQAPYYREHDEKPSPNAIPTDHGWEVPK